METLKPFIPFHSRKLVSFAGNSSITVNVTKQAAAQAATVVLYANYGAPPMPVATKTGSSVVFDNLPTSTDYNIVAFGGDDGRLLASQKASSGDTVAIELFASGSGPGNGSSAHATIRRPGIV